MSDFSEERSCKGKKRYGEHEHARQKWIQSIRSRRSSARGLHVYYCEFCKGYHIGHRPKQRS